MRLGRLYSRVFSLTPAAAAISSLIIASLLLFLPALLLRIGNLPTAGPNFGFFYRANWFWMFLIGIPFLLFLSCHTFKSMSVAANELAGPKRLVIISSEGAPAPEFGNWISQQLERWSEPMALLATAAALLITAYDTWDLWPGFFTSKFSPERANQWEIAFRAKESWHKWGVFSFDIFAYLLQTVAIALGLYFVGMMWAFLRLIARTMDPMVLPYRFQPMIFDPEKRLGLRPLAGVFNVFLMFIVGYQVYAFVRRLQQIAENEKSPLFRYIKTTLDGIWEAPDKLLLPKLETWGLQRINDASVWFPILIALFPIVVVLTFPLGRIYWHIRAKRLTLIDENALKISKLRAAGKGDNPQVKIFEDTNHYLLNSNIWPNGDLAGWLFLLAIVALLFGSFAPPVLFYAMLAGMAGSVWKFAKFLGKKAGDKGGD